MNKYPEGRFGPNKYHLSYSGWYLWETNPAGYRKRYYEGEPSFETTETIFGKLVADWLESDDPRVKHIPNYKRREYDLEVMVGDAKIVGRLDGFDDEEIRFLDHKSAHANSKGEAPWNAVKVRQLKQLPFYSMLLKEKFGKVKNLCHLVWIETGWKKDTVEFNGHTLEAGGRELVLTGRVKKFSRTIREFERKKIKEDLLKAIKEIEQDYANYRKTNQGSNVTNG